jgi:hypothetical protein
MSDIEAPQQDRERLRGPMRSVEAANSQDAGDGEGQRNGFWWWGLLVLLLTLIAGANVGVYLFKPVKREVAKQRVEHAFFFPVEGADAKGRRAAFDFIILTKDFTWVKGSTFEVESKGRVVPEAQVIPAVFTPQIRKSLTQSPGLIAVGLASQEGGKAAEEQRASRRSRTVASWMLHLAGPHTHVWRLNLGQYKSECSGQVDRDTSFQRPLILIGVLRAQEGVDLAQALADAIGGKANLPSRECYSRFDLSRIR